MISIIIPVYNAERWLGRCLESLSEQTLRDVEIICVNDGSTDGSARILGEYARRDPRIAVLSWANAGMSAARNRGMEAARGEWIMLADADDWIDPDTCERALEAATLHSADVVLWAYMREREDGRQIPRSLVVGDREFSGEDVRRLHRKMVGPVGDELRDPTLLHSWGTAWGKLYNRREIAHTRFIDTRIVGTEDALFNIEVFGRVKRAFYIDRPMYHYRTHGTSSTGGYNANLVRGWERLYSMVSDIITSGNLGDDFNAALDNRIALSLVGYGLNECRSTRNRAGKIAALKEIISTERYRRAISSLPLVHLPIHWKIFFGAAKRGNAALVLVLLRIIEKLR